MSKKYKFGTNIKVKMVESNTLEDQMSKLNFRPHSPEQISDEVSINLYGATEYQAIPELSETDEERVRKEKISKGKYTLMRMFPYMSPDKVSHIEAMITDEIALFGYLYMNNGES